MFLNSIRWRLQLWYGLILVVVLAGFGFTAYQLERNRQFRALDVEFQRRFAALFSAFVPRPFDRSLDNNLPGRFGPHDDEFGHFPGHGPKPPSEPEEFHLTSQQTALFGGDTNTFYYVIWSREGKELARSDNAPADVTRPPFTFTGLDSPQSTPQMRGIYREASRSTPGGTILVGRSVAPELDELRLAALKLLGVGGAILLLGLAGGWWIATKAMRPIEDISATAMKISTGDLSQRIPTHDTESELGHLAGVLNSTFARLEAAFTQQARFTSDAAHELRTPVSVILTQTQTTLNRERSPAEYRETLEACQRAAQRMRRLTESLLELARIDAGQETLHREKFDLAATAQNCAELIRSLAVEKHVTIQTELTATPCIGDPDRLAQVITNLLTNAIQYNWHDGVVRIATRSEKGFAVLTVIDNGMGISAEDLPRVFERFYRADKSRTDGSTGLGLAICKAIVQAHTGTIEVSSQPNAGTAFTVRLPASL